MAGRGTCVSIALAFALVLLHVSVCKCETVTFSSKSDVLSENEREIVLSVMQLMVENVERDIDLKRDYYAGRLFTKYIHLNDQKGVVVRLTRWSRDCSVSMSSSDTTKGSDLLEAFKQLLPTIRPYLMKGHEWVAVSKHTDWIDYYVRKPYNGEKEPPLRLADAPTYKILSEGAGSSVTDCAIQPTMLLSHHSALAFNQMHPGDYLLSPDGKYKLTIPQSGRVMAPCMLNLEDQNGNVLWQSGPNRPVPQLDCTLAFRTDGTLELWNGNNRIWFTDSACASVTKCAGAASLALKDGDFKLYRSVDDHLSSYWSARGSN